MFTVSYYIANIRIATAHTDAHEAYEHFNKLEKDFQNVDLSIIIEDTEYFIIWNYAPGFIRP